MRPPELDAEMPRPHGGAQLYEFRKSSQQLETHLYPAGQLALLLQSTEPSQK